MVVVPALDQHTRSWGPLVTALSGEREFGPEEAEWLCFDHGIRRHTRGRLAPHARDLKAIIDGRWRQRQGSYEEIVLVGHSIGGLIIRQAYVLGRGWDSTARLEESAWADRVKRIVLFAGINRGFSADDSFRYRLVSFAKRAVPIPLPHLVVQDVVRGSDFITDMRINWIRNFRQLELTVQREGRGELPTVVQLLGTRDDRVSGVDSDDVLALPNSRQILVPFGSHGNLYRLDQTHDPDLRYALIRDALLSPPPARAAPKTAARTDTPARRVGQVVFLLHGIRAGITDDWQSKLASHLHASASARRPPGAPGADSVHVVQPAYGYFTAAKFARPSTRRKNIGWFQDQYTEILARHPDAQFNIIAHSNGTYMLGQSLARVPAMRFGNVALAGSVLPETYPWADRINDGQVKVVRNDVAKQDWPVGILSNGLQSLGMRDVGTGGFNGFMGTSTHLVAYHPGGHGAAFDSDAKIKGIARFALTGAVPPHVAVPPGLDTLPGMMHMVSRTTPWIVRAGAAAAAVLLFDYVHHEGQFSPRRIGLATVSFSGLYFLLDVI